MTNAKNEEVCGDGTVASTEGHTSRSRWGKKAPGNAIGTGFAQSLPPASTANKKNERFLSLKVLGVRVESDDAVAEEFLQRLRFATSFPCAYSGGVMAEASCA